MKIGGKRFRLRPGSWILFLVAFIGFMYAGSPVEAERYETNGPNDFYFTLEEANLFSARAYAIQYGIDSMLWLYDSSNNIISANDDYFGLDSYVSIVLQPGEYRLRTGVCCGNPDAWYGSYYEIETNLSVISNQPTTTSTTSTTTSTSTTTTSTTSTSTTTTSTTSTSTTTTSIVEIPPTSIQEETTTTAVAIAPVETSTSTTTSTTSTSSTTTTEAPPPATSSSVPESTTTTLLIPQATASTVVTTTTVPQTTTVAKETNGGETSQTTLPKPAPNEENEAPKTDNKEVTPQSLLTLTEEKITPAIVKEVLNVITGGEANKEEIAAAISVLIEAGSIDSDVATQLATSAVVLQSISGDSASEVFDALDVSSITSDTAELLVMAVQGAPTEVKESFEEEINVFGGKFDGYVPLDSNISVGERRTVVAVTVVSSVIAVSAASAPPTSSGGGSSGGGGGGSPSGGTSDGGSPRRRRGG